MGYFGDSNDANTMLVINTINSHFTDEILYIALTRKKSTVTARKKIKQAIDNLAGFDNFLIWDAYFKKAIEFNRIGTLGCGELKNR